MTRILFFLAFLLGACAVIWMAAIFMGADALALTVTLVIGGVYALGGLEMHRFRQATSSLKGALDVLPEELDRLEPWLDKLSPSLRNAVQSRVEGERVGLPAPVLTPYLVGLLVMLGLLGTFVGMVETLQGAVVALEGTNELQAIRAGLAAPIAGLGLAFGTSVAGVAASAMLGLMSTLGRRERMLETRRLDQKIASSLRAFSLNHSRQETYRALQSQADTLPAVAERMDTLAEKLERMSERLGENLTANQVAMHESVQTLFTDLAATVEKTLNESVAENSRVAAESGKQVGESLKPILENTVAEIQTEVRTSAEKTRQYLTETSEQTQQYLSETAEKTQRSLSENAVQTQQHLREKAEQTQQHLRETAEQTQQHLTRQADTTYQQLTSETDTAQQQINNAAESTLNQLGESSARTQQQLVESVERILAQLATSADTSQQALTDGARKTLDSLTQTAATTQQKLIDTAADTQQQLSETSDKQLQSITERFSQTAEDVSRAWSNGLDAHRSANQSLVEQTGDSLKSFETEFERLSSALLDAFKSAVHDWVIQQQSGDSERIEHWKNTFTQGQQQASDQLVENAKAFAEELRQVSTDQQQSLQKVAAGFEAASESVSSQWREAGERSATQQTQLAESLQQTARDIRENWQDTSGNMLSELGGLLKSSEALVQQRIDNEGCWLEGHRERMSEVADVLKTQLESLRNEEQSRGEAAVSRLAELETAVAGQLAELGQSLEAPMTRLIETASEAPRAAAEVIEHLRGEISKSIERDNGLLTERRDVLVELNSLSESIQQTAAGQQQAIEHLVEASTDKLQAIGEQFNQQVTDESSKMTELVALFAGSSAELSSLGEAFGVAVERFSESNNAMVDNLNRIEASLTEAGSRSDEQLGYYVAQAREIIDQSILSQQQMLDGLRQVSEQRDTAAVS